MRKTTPTAAVTSMTAAEFKETKQKTKTPTGANALTKSVIERINITPNCFAFRVNNGGVYDPTKGIFRTHNGTKGIADVLACIHGAFVAIEIKVGKDVQSVFQIAFEQDTRKANGVYIIVSDIRHFENWFADYLKKMS